MLLNATKYQGQSFYHFFVFNTVVSIQNGKNIIIEPIDPTVRNGIMIYCDELPFGILSPYQYLNTETRNIISYYAGENESLFGMY